MSSYDANMSGACSVVVDMACSNGEGRIYMQGLFRVHKCEVILVRQGSYLIAGHPAMSTPPYFWSEEIFRLGLCFPSEEHHDRTRRESDYAMSWCCV